MSDALASEIKQMIVERCFLKIEPESIADEDDLLGKGLIDSVELLETVAGLEEVYGIAVDDEDFSVERFSTVKAIAEFVREKKGEEEQ